MNPRSVVLLLLLGLGFAASWIIAQAPDSRCRTDVSPCERLSFNDDWRTAKGDPDDRQSMIHLMLNVHGFW